MDMPINHPKAAIVPSGGMSDTEDTGKRLLITL
jgi:hypothetical protein